MSLTIGMFTDTYLPQINGVATLLPILDRLLSRQGHRVYIFAPSYEGSRPRLEDEKVFRFPAIKFLYHKESRVTIPYHREARRAFEELDLVHSHTPFSLGVLGIRVARRYGIPHLHTYHTLFTEYLHYLPRYLRPTPNMVARISAAFCNRCDAVTVPSNPMREELLSYGIEAPVYTLPFGMDLDDFAGEPRVDLRAKLGIPERERILLCAGRVAEEKNISFLLRAFRLMLKELPHLRLIIAGDGPARPRLEGETEELGIAERVIFTGYVAWRELIDYYKQADLFVYASKTETQGIVFVESLAAGTPVVAVGEMGALEAVEDGVDGLLLEEDEEAFAQAVVELLHNEERLKRMSRAAVERAYQMSAQRSVEKLLEIYKEMIGAKQLAHQA
jgi:glycosyltransferase involved in cell wall biosynthesis